MYDLNDVLYSKEEIDEIQGSIKRMRDDDMKRFATDLKNSIASLPSGASQQEIGDTIDKACKLLRFKIMIGESEAARMAKANFMSKAHCVATAYDEAVFDGGIDARIDIRQHLSSIMDNVLSCHFESH